MTVPVQRSSTCTSGCDRRAVAVITKKDLDSAIAECQGKRNPDANTCIKLAAFYTIKREMFGEDKDTGYSYAPAPSRSTIETNSGSEFARMIDGKDFDSVFPVIDELMETLSIIQPRLYNAVMDKLA